VFTFYTRCRKSEVTSSQRIEQQHHEATIVIANNTKMVRTSGAKDKNQRKRRKPTGAEKKQQQERANATRREKARKEREVAERARPAANFFQPHSVVQQQTNNDGNNDVIVDSAYVEGATNDNANHDGDGENNDDEQLNNNDEHNEKDKAVTIDFNTDSATNITHSDITAALDVEEGEDDGRDEDDVDEDEDGNIINNNKNNEGTQSVMQEVVEAVQNRIKHEESPSCKGLNEKWLLKYLGENEWSIPRNKIPWLVKKLKLNHDTSLFKYYYTRLDVWLPDRRWGPRHMPCCPNCKHNNAVGVHGYSVHPGRKVIGLDENYYILGCRYICSDCKKEKKRLKEAAKSAASAAANVDVEIEITTLDFKITFMGWDKRILPLFLDGRGKQFPATLTKRSGLCNRLIDLMRPLFNKSLRPEAFSDLLLELHTKEWTRRHIEYEREVAMNERLFPGSAKTKAMFSDFGDSRYYDDEVPTGKYIKLVYNLYHESIREHLEKEVKKRPCDVIYWDASYKIDKRMNQHNGEQVFKGLITGMNQIGEIRFQFHIHTDSHDQMVAALEAFKVTVRKLGMNGPKYFVTDNPRADAAFFLSIFESLREEQQRLNNEYAVVDTIPSLGDEYFVREYVKLLTSAQEVNNAITAMYDVAKVKVIGLDAEWNVTLNRHGYATNTGKVALIQISYLDTSDNIVTLLIRTHKMKKLPHALETLLTRDTFKIVGVNVSADLIKIGKDFDINSILKVAQKDRPNVINLGPFARARDVVSSGTVSLQHLSERVLKKRLDKSSETRLSDWDRNELSEKQTKYAALDSIVSLKIFIEVDKMPDLTRRYTMDDVSIGNTVDLVPMHGSVSCMATRAATGVIVDVAECESPDNITPRLTRAGNGTVAIKIVEIYSPGFKVPAYTYQPPDCQESPATLVHFKEGCCIVVPIRMLKHHVNSNQVRSTPTNTSGSSITTPAEYHDAPQPIQDDAEITARDDTGDDMVNVIVNSLEDGDFLQTELSQLDIELVRAAQEQRQAASMQSVLNLFPCKHLSDSPSPNDIPNVWSCILGDAFHAMKRIITPMHHDAKKAFFVALRDAFFIWDEEKLAELMAHMRDDDGMTQDEIDNKMMFSPSLFTDCVPRYIPPASLLYFRVRAVFVLFGDMKDSKTKKPLFNAKAWKSANNVLSEILDGYYSDPPGVKWYTKRLKKNGAVATNKYGMDLLDCSRGTNRVESFHKDLITDWGSWPMGMEMSKNLLAEKRHRHNHRVAEKRRDGFPKIGHYDTWEVDELQLLVYKNRGFFLFPNWSNSSEYITTEESFDIVPLQSKSDQAALQERCDELEREGPLPKLTRELQFQCNAMGTPLPFLPFSNDSERMKFSEYVQSLSPITTVDDKQASLYWNRHFVDGINIWPKLPVHIRTYIRKWERNQRSKDLFKSCKSGRDKLAELNSIKPAAATADVPLNYSSIPIPPPMPQPNSMALHNQQYTIVANSVIGTLTTNAGIKRRRGDRGKDAPDVHRLPRPRRCMNCVKNNGDNFATCAGRTGRGTCQFFPP
jgi:hypothetical protein